MKFQELLILLPCHSLEDFPTYHEGDDADSLLASWSALWHPELLAAAGQAPTWRRIEDPPSDLNGKLIVVPAVCAQKLPTGFAQRCKDEGGLLIRKTSDRAEIVAAALAALDIAPTSGRGNGLAGASPSQETSPDDGTRSVPATCVDPDLAADFLALGYAYLQIQLLTRQMRYSSNLDETYFKNTTLAAAVAAVAGNAALAKEKLSACFSVLAEERDHYYPVDAFLIDLNMVAPTTLGASLRAELSRETPTSVLLSGDLLAEMAVKEPETLASLRAGLESGRVGLAGGEATEGRLPLLSHDAILAELRRGLAIYERHLGRRPEVFGRWRFGLTPHLPGILHRLGFRGALHASFDEGKTPDGLQLKIRWEGLDGSAIDAIARTPLDASKPQTFLSLATKMGESMDADHVATICLAHWPGQASPWLDDLRRIARYCSALGKFVTLDQYFRETGQPGQLDRFEADRYRSPYLKQAIIRKQEDPISTPAREWQQEAAASAAQTLATLATLVAGRASGIGSRELASGGREPPEASGEQAIATAATRLASVLTGPSSKTTPGCLVINPASFIRRIGAEVPGIAAPPTIERPVYAADDHGGFVHAVVDVPALGFAHLTPGKPTSRDKNTLLLVEDNVLRNEFFEAIINPTTGTLAAVHEYKSRGNRLSQQLALRSPGPKQKPGDTYRDPDESAVYSVMAADSLETTIATTTLGEIVARGRLLDQNGNKLAGFTQTYRLWRGSRVLHVEVELDPAEEPKADPWNSYYCARIAWADEGAELFRTQHQTRQPCTEKRFESSHYIEIAGTKNTTTILTGGLTFHRRHEHRMFDTLLISRGERQRIFRLGIGVDLAHPLHDAIGLLTPPIVVPNVPAPTSGSSGWLMHLSARNVIATQWEPLDEGGRITGFRVRLLETEGRPASLALSAFRAIKSANTVDFLGNSLAELAIDNGKIKVELAAYEWAELVAQW